MPRLLLASVALASLGPLSAVARGDLLPIVNQGFEDQVVTDGDFIRGTLTGWSALGDSGVFNPTTASLPSQPSEGVNVAFIGGTFAGGPIRQTLATVLTAGSYALRIDVGDRLDTSFAGYSIGLFAGDALLAQDNNSMTPSNGTFVTSLTTFTALASDVNLGQPLAIKISASNDGSGFQTLFDDVRLAWNAVPDPADFDEDGDVDANDLSRWKTGFGATGAATHMLGDADADLDVDGADFLIWQRQLAGSSATSVSTAAPEPAAVLLLAAALPAIARRRRVAPLRALRDFRSKNL
jgi:hypothetical protein